jgi:cob(I)alamin adenosyltransferase
MRRGYIRVYTGEGKGKTIAALGLALCAAGRYTDERVTERSALVTEMREIKHYHRKGAKARVGIEK